MQEQDRLALAGAAHTNARATGDQCLYFGCHGQSQPCSLPSITANLRPAVSGRNSANNRLNTAPTMPNIIALKRLPRSAAITGTRYGIALPIRRPAVKVTEAPVERSSTGNNSEYHGPTKPMMQTQVEASTARLRPK